MGSIEPLEAVINPRYDRDPFERFRALYQKELARGEADILDAKS